MVSLIVTDMDMIVQRAYHDALPVLTLSPEAFMGKSLLDLFVRDDRRLLSHELAAWTKEGIKQARYQLGGAGRPPQPVRMTIVPVRNDDEALVGFHWLLHHA